MLELWADYVCILINYSWLSTYMQYVWFIAESKTEKNSSTHVHGEAVHMASQCI